MGAEIRIHCPMEDNLAARGALEFELKDTLASAGRIIGGGSGLQEWNIDLRLADGEDWGAWVDRLREFLRKQQAPAGSYLDVFPPECDSERPPRRFEVYTGDERV